MNFSIKFQTKKDQMVEIIPASLEYFPKFLDFMNELVREDTFIYRIDIRTVEGEKEKFEQKLQDMKDGKSFYIWTLFEEKIIGASSIVARKGRGTHVWELGIMVDKNFRGEGLGYKLMEVVMDKAKELGVKIVVLERFPENKIAGKLYEKFGFQECGRIPKALYRKNKYSDEIIMYKEIV